MAYYGNAIGALVVFDKTELPPASWPYADQFGTLKVIKIDHQMPFNTYHLRDLVSSAVTSAEGSVLKAYVPTHDEPVPTPLERVEGVMDITRKMLR